MLDRQLASHVRAWVGCSGRPHWRPRRIAASAASWLAVSGPMAIAGSQQSARRQIASASSSMPQPTPAMCANWPAAPLACSAHCLGVLGFARTTSAWSALVCFGCFVLQLARCLSLMWSTIDALSMQHGACRAAAEHRLPPDEQHCATQLAADARMQLRSRLKAEFECTRRAACGPPLLCCMLRTFVVAPSAMVSLKRRHVCDVWSILHRPSRRPLLSHRETHMPRVRWMACCDQPANNVHWLRRRGQPELRVAPQGHTGTAAVASTSGLFQAVRGEDRLPHLLDKCLCAAASWACTRLSCAGAACRTGRDVAVRPDLLMRPPRCDHSE